jgi:hypothetical protein
MTDQTPQPEPQPDASPPAAEPTTEPQEPAEPQIAALHREAAARRRELRATEGERDELRQRVDVMERREVERLAAVQMESAGDFWTVGPSLEELRGEDGQLDLDKAREAIDGVLADRPHWRRRVGPSDGGARDRGPVQRRQPGLSDLLKQ